MTTSPTTPEVLQQESIELDISGMTCASCAMRIEKKLNKIDGVTATVNYATEKARVSVPAGFEPTVLIAEVEKTGYGATLPAADVNAPDPDDQGEDPELTSLRHRLVGSIVLSVPVIVLAMAPTLQFTYWQWASLVLAAPVIVWAGWPFHRAAFTNLRHGAATMDTLISVGTSAALLWSLYALFFGTAGVPGMTHAFEFTIAPTDGARELLDALTEAGIPMALVTNTRRGLTERALNSIGHHYFSASVCGDEVEHAKPAPDPYLRAAALLGVEPTQCLAIEDSVTGTLAAESAGCPVLVVPNDVEVPTSARRSHVKSLKGLTVADLRGVHADLSGVAVQ